MRFSHQSKNEYVLNKIQKTLQKTFSRFRDAIFFASGHTLRMTEGVPVVGRFSKTGWPGWRPFSFVTAQLPNELPNSNTRLKARLIKMRNIPSKNYLWYKHSCTTPQAHSINTFSLLPNPLVHTTSASPGSWFSQVCAPLSNYIRNSYNSALL